MRNTYKEPVPTRLRVVEGRLVLEDGTDATEYLKAQNFKPDMPVTLINSSYVQKLENERWFNSCA